MNFYECFVLPIKKGFAFIQIIFKRLTLGSVFKYTRFLKKSNTERKELSGSRALNASWKWGSRRCYSIKGVVGLK